MSFPMSANKSVLLGQVYADIYNPPRPDGTRSAILEVASGFNASHSSPRKNGKWVHGNNWLMWKSTTTRASSATLQVWSGNNPSKYFGPRYVGRFIASDPGTTPADFGQPTGWNSSSGLNSFNNSLALRGAEALAKMRPDLPDFSLANELYELKDLPGMFRDVTRAWRDRSRYTAKDLGSDHLAFQFGWLPILSSIRDFVKTQSSMQKRVDQLIKDSGKPVKRSTTLRDSKGDSDSIRSSSSSASTAGSRVTPVFGTGCYVGTSTGTFTATFSAKTWAKGTYQYMLPAGPRTVQYKKKLMRKLMGLQIGPAELYQAMPWSWLIDYFSDLGHFVNAVVPGVAESGVWRHAYVMRETTEVRRNHVTQGLRGPGGSQLEAEAVTTTTFTVKGRVGASPFGFGMSQNSLSPRQVGILGALGLSRL